MLTPSPGVLRAVVRPGPVRRAVVIGTLTLAATLILLWDAPPELEPRAQRTLAIFVVALGLWVSKALPLMVTSMLAIILFPLFGVCEAKTAFAHFGHPAVFFILGTFILSAGLSETGLARRLALRLIWATGHSPPALVTGIFSFGLVASCVVSEHAVAALELPIVLELVRALEGRGSARDGRRLARAMFLAVAWGCVIGGVTTFLGGARAPVALGILDEGWGLTVSFWDYTAAALPVMLPVAAVGLVLVRWLARGLDVDLVAGRELLTREIERMGSVSKREIAMGALLCVTVVLWIATGPQWLAVIALAAISVGFLCELITWPWVHERVDWGLILMYGGAVVVGAMVVDTGLARWAGQALLRSLEAYAITWMLTPLLSVVALLLTEGCSNAAVVAATVPVAVPLALELGLSATAVTVLITLASGFAFLLPMATPALAMALASGHVRPLEMIRWGLPLKVVSAIALMAAERVVWPWLGMLGG
jgi:sodium-dependent dicarboxylate transporter 2/3/5